MDYLTRLNKNNHFKYGLPFIIMVVGGSSLLKFYSQARYDLHNERHIITKTKPVSIEEEYSNYKENVDLSDWQNIRGPRPWEGDNQKYKELIEKRARESKKQWVFSNY